MSAHDSIDLFGHHLIVGLSGTALNDEDKRLLAEIKPAGIILFDRNFVRGVPYEIWLTALKELLDSVRQYSEREQMLITLDHEGGRVVRTPAPITRFPEACLYRHRSYEVAIATAKELRSLGVNVSWAPVADIHSNPANPIIGPRAFSSSAEIAANYATEYLRGLTDSGIWGCAKHFPGHGDTLTDSHLELPSLSLTMAELRARELVPFQSMINYGVPLIMTAHISFPLIDKNLPATLSRTVLHDLLRDEMKYQGIVVSDDLDMRAVSEIFSRPANVIRLFEAGCDMAIIARSLSTSTDRTYSIARQFAVALAEASLNSKVIERSRARVDALLAGTPQHSVVPLNTSLLERHSQIAIEIAIQ